MKKAGLILLCLVVFLAALAGGWVWLSMTPRGALRADVPETLMQEFIDSHDRSWWRAEYCRLSPAAVTEFEDAQQVTGSLFDAAVPEGSFSFRELPGGSSGETQRYVISAGGTDILIARFDYVNRQWAMTTESLSGITGATRTVTVTAPEGTALSINGVAVGDGYITDAALPYGDMTELELRFDSRPHLVRWAVPGLYEPVELTAEREGGLVLLSADGTDWVYTAPDAAGYAFRVSAPKDVQVSVNGALLTEADAVESIPYETLLNIPPELQPFLPEYRVYAAGGLYTRPEVSASLADGTVLAPDTLENGELRFPLLPSPQLYEAFHQRVEDFLYELLRYGAGETYNYNPSRYAVPGSEVHVYMERARASLYWVSGVEFTFREVSSSDFFSLGDGAFLCRGHADFTTKTRQQTRDIDLRYEMLWVNNGGVWQISDLAFL